MLGRGMTAATAIVTNVCPTCGCSLVRLGIKPQDNISATVDGEKYYFCCEACRMIFSQNPPRFIKEASDLYVCPVCLAEKIGAHTVPVTYEGSTIRFCRCPFCEQTFKKNADYYIDRLNGNTDFKGLFDGQDTACCAS